MTAIENLIIDFKAEINQKEFGNKMWEEDSYQYMVGVVEMAHKLDHKIPKSKIMSLLNENVSLQEAYLNVIEFLERLK